MLIWFSFRFIQAIYWYIDLNVAYLLFVDFTH